MLKVLLGMTGMEADEEALKGSQEVLEGVWVSTIIVNFIYINFQNGDFPVCSAGPTPYLRQVFRNIFSPPCFDVCLLVVQEHEANPGKNR